MPHPKAVGFGDPLARDIGEMAMAVIMVQIKAGKIADGDQVRVAGKGSEPKKVSEK